jgi:hypothetical protein
LNKNKKEKEKVVKKKKKSKKKKSKDNNGSVNSKEENESVEGKDSNSLDLSIPSSNSPTPQLDDEGYIVRPKSASHTKSVDSFYSSSDSDSDSEEKVKKIHIRIKPLTNGTLISASVDELIASVGTLSLSPAANYSVGHSHSLFLSYKLSITILSLSRLLRGEKMKLFKIE